MSFVTRDRRFQESVLANASLAEPIPVDYDDDTGVVVSTDNDTHSESQEEQQNVRMHTPPLTYDIPSLPQNVEVTISGTGCAILQVNSSLLN